MSAADFSVTDHGTIVTIGLLTDAAREWAAEHLPEDAARWGSAVAVETRYAGPIIEGMADDGLVAK